MENQQKEIFANCSQTHFAMRKFRRPISQCENSPTQIRNAKISQCEISQCQMPFRNAKIDFAMPILISQCENFAMRKFRNAKFRNAKCHFAMRKSRNSKFAMRKFRNAKFRNAKAHFALRKSLPLRNSPCEIYRPCHPL